MGQHILAGLRALAAKKLRKKGMKHEEISKLLKVDRTVVTHYLSDRIPGKEAINCAKIIVEEFYSRDAVLFIKSVCNDNKVIKALTEILISENIVVDVAISSECNLCGICIDACPTNVITINKNIITIDKNNCCGCELCQELCPKEAIFLKIIEDKRKKKNKKKDTI